MGTLKKRDLQNMFSRGRGVLDEEKGEEVLSCPLDRQGGPCEVGTLKGGALQNNQ